MLLEMLILIGALSAFAYLCLGVYALLWADRIIFPKLPPADPAPPEAFFLEDKDGERISALHLANQEARQTLLYSHGNRETLASIDWLLKAHRARGFNVMAYDYPGYGQSSGCASESGVYAAAEAAYAFLIEKKGVKPEDIILYGRSLGGGPTSYLASKYPVGGVILEATFISAFRVKTRFPLLPWDSFSNLSRIRRIKAPILFIHGTEDAVVPFAHAKKLLRAAGPGQSYLWVEGGGHSRLMEFAGAGYWRKIAEFAKVAAAHQ